jgi:hypothetical protein
MAAGFVTITVDDGDGNPRSFRKWSDDGTVTGNLYDVFVDPVTLSPVSPTAPVAIKGGTAEDSAIADPPVPNGGRAATGNRTGVSDGDVVHAMHDPQGKQIVVPAIRGLKAIQTTTITSSTSETTIVTAGAAGVFKDLYSLIISNTSATACNVTIKDATSGTTRFIVPVPAASMVGFNRDAGSAVIQAAAASNWTATCSPGVASIIITAETVANV